VPIKNESFGLALTKREKDITPRTLFEGEEARQTMIKERCIDFLIEALSFSLCKPTKTIKNS